MKHKNLTTRFVVGLLGIALALSLTLWIGCGESDIPSNPEASEEATIAAAPPGNRLEFVMEVQERHTPWIMQIPGVVGIATGHGAGRPVIMVFTETSGVPRVPGNLDGVPVIVRVTGKIYALAKGGVPGPPDGGGGGGGDDKEKIDRSARFERPVPIGVSTGHPDITAGTIACRVKKNQNFYYALSNNHVYADINTGPMGVNVLQPGPSDGGQNPADAIGTLYAYEEILFDGSPNTVDAAIALSDETLLGNATPSDGYGTPKSDIVLPADALGEGVIKYGQASGETKGTVAGIGATVSVNYGGGNVALFIDQLVITPGGFSRAGDSGSLVVIQKGADARKPVGLLFAGGQGLTIANPIYEVLHAFHVEIDGE